MGKVIQLSATRTRTITAQNVATGTTVGIAIVGLGVLLGIFSSAVALSVLDTRSVQIAATTDSGTTISKLTTQLFNQDTALKAGDKSVTESSLLTLAKQRSALMVALAQSDPFRFLDLALTAEQRGVLSKGVQAEVEQWGDLTGTVAVSLLEDARSGKALYSSALFVGNNRITLSPAEKFRNLQGATVALHGVRLKNVFVPGIGATDTTVTKASKINQISGEQRFATLLFEQTGVAMNQTPTSFSQLFATQSAINDFYREQSYGALSFRGDFYGVFNHSPSTGCVRPQPQQLNAALGAQGVDLSAYNFYVVFFATRPDQIAACGQATFLRTESLTVGGNVRNVPVIYHAFRPGIEDKVDPTTFAPFRVAFDSSLAHEFGHALGLAHAAGYDCGGQTDGTSCTYVEYGDLFDIMGPGYGPTHHFNGYVKKLLGWLPAASVQQVRASGTFELKSLRSAAGVRLLEIIPQGLQDPLFTLEWRQPTGFDALLSRSPYSANLNGIFLHKILTLTNTIPFTELLDLSPAITGTWNTRVGSATLNPSIRPVSPTDFFINPSPRLTVPNSGVSLTVSNVSGDTLTLKVDIAQGQCVRSPVNFSLNRATGTYMSGTSGVSVGAIVSNRDSDICGSSRFKIEVLNPAGAVVSDSQLTLKPQESLFLSTPVDRNDIRALGVGVHTLTVKVTNLDSGLSATLPYVLEVLEVPAASSYVGIVSAQFVEGGKLLLELDQPLGTSYLTTYIDDDYETLFVLNAVNNSITVGLPGELSAGQHQIAIDWRGVRSNTETFEVPGKPEITSLSPASGGAGRQVEIRGNRLGLIGDTKVVKFGQTPVVLSERNYSRSFVVPELQYICANTLPPNTECSEFNGGMIYPTAGTAYPVTLTVNGIESEPVYFTVEGVSYVAYGSGGEFGTVTNLTNEWTTIVFKNQYDAPPVVIAKPVTSNGDAPTHARIRNVTGTSFDIRLENWKYSRSLAHRPEVASIMVVPEGRTNFPGGFSMEAGFKDGVTDVFTPVQFAELFGVKPVVFTMSQTYTGVGEIVMRNKDISGRGFSVRVQEEEAEGVHVSERIGYVAMTPYVGLFPLTNIPFEVGRWDHVRGTEIIDYQQKYDSNPLPIFIADVQTFNESDTIALRRLAVGTSYVWVVLEEEVSKDAETTHAPEEVGYAVFQFNSD